MSKFKSELSGKRLTLKRNKPTIKTSAQIFKVIDENRKHLLPWFPWAKTERRVEDLLNYLMETEKKFKVGETVNYGIYLGKDYIGNLGIFNINKKNKSAEIGYWLSEKHLRQGYMSEAVGILEKEFFLNFGLNRIQIKCDERNIPSTGVAKKCGYLFEGKNREDVYSDYYRDFRTTLVFSKLKKDYIKK